LLSADCTRKSQSTLLCRFRPQAWAKSRRRCGSVPAPTWPSRSRRRCGSVRPGADVGQSVPAQMWASRSRHRSAAGAPPYSPRGSRAAASPPALRP
jgi:hypothetical protein